MRPPQGPIQTLPPGLLSALGLQGVGQLPDVLMGSVQPIIDLTESYLQVARQPLQSSAYTVAAGAGAYSSAFYASDIVIPPTEWWFVHNITVVQAAPPGDKIDPGVLGAAYRQPGGVVGIVAQASLAGLTAGAAGASQFSGGDVRRMFSPGTIFGSVAPSGVSVAGNTGLVWMDVTKLRF